MISIAQSGRRKKQLAAAAEKSRLMIVAVASWFPQVHNWRFFGADIGSEGGREREWGTHTTSLPSKVNFSPLSSAPWEPGSETVCTGFLLEIYFSSAAARNWRCNVPCNWPCRRRFSLLSPSLFFHVFYPRSYVVRLPRRSSLGSQWPYPKCTRRACALAARMFPISPFLMPKLGTIKENLGRAHIVGSVEQHVCRLY